MTVGELLTILQEVPTDYKVGIVGDSEEVDVEIYDGDKTVLIFET